MNWVDRVEKVPVALGKVSGAGAFLGFLSRRLHAIAYGVELVSKREIASDKYAAGHVGRAIGLAGEIAEDCREPAAVLSAVGIVLDRLFLKFAPLRVPQSLVEQFGNQFSAEQNARQ